MNFTIIELQCRLTELEISIVQAEGIFETFFFDKWGNVIQRKRNADGTLAGKSPAEQLVDSDPVLHDAVTVPRNNREAAIAEHLRKLFLNQVAYTLAEQDLQKFNQEFDQIVNKEIAKKNREEAIKRKKEQSELAYQKRVEEALKEVKKFEHPPTESPQTRGAKALEQLLNKLYEHSAKYKVAEEDLKDFNADFDKMLQRSEPRSEPEKVKEVKKNQVPAPTPTKVTKQKNKNGIVESIEKNINKGKKQLEEQLKPDSKLSKAVAQKAQQMTEGYKKINKQMDQLIEKSKKKLDEYDKAIKEHNAQQLEHLRELKKQHNIT